MHEQNAFEDLREEVADEVLLEMSRVLNIVVELATSDQILNDVRYLVALVWLLHHRLLAEAMELYDVLVLELG